MLYLVMSNINKIFQVLSSPIVPVDCVQVLRPVAVIAPVARSSDQISQGESRGRRSSMVAFNAANSLTSASSERLG
jgi:hypothetical protein